MHFVNKANLILQFWFVTNQIRLLFRMSSEKMPPDKTSLFMASVHLSYGH